MPGGWCRIEGEKLACREVGVGLKVRSYHAGRMVPRIPNPLAGAQVEGKMQPTRRWMRKGGREGGRGGGPLDEGALVGKEGLGFDFGHSLQCCATSTAQ
jgi:hypothetical protein